MHSCWCTILDLYFPSNVWTASNFTIFYFAQRFIFRFKIFIFGLKLFKLLFFSTCTTPFTIYHLPEHDTVCYTLLRFDLLTNNAVNFNHSTKMYFCSQRISSMWISLVFFLFSETVDIFHILCCIRIRQTLATYNTTASCTDRFSVWATFNKSGWGYSFR